MEKHFFKGCLAAAASLLLVSGCTLSEPSEAKGSAKGWNLTGLKSIGVNLMTVNYDSQNRVTKINYSGDKFEFTYQGNSKIPVSALRTDDDGSEIWENIQANADGYITSFDVTETDDRNYGNLSWHESMTYDGKHLTSISDDEGTMTFNWNGNLLTSVLSADGDTYFEYSDVNNVNLQWDPTLEGLGPVAITGFFGEAPSKFVKTERHNDEGYVTERQIAYTLLDNGLIHMSKAAVSDDDELDIPLTLTFTYAKKK